MITWARVMIKATKGKKERRWENQADLIVMTGW